jgi:hypothetical protein
LEARQHSGFSPLARKAQAAAYGCAISGDYLRVLARSRARHKRQLTEICASIHPRF